MKNDIKKILSKMFHPDIVPIKRRIIGFAVTTPITFSILYFYYDFSAFLSICIILFFYSIFGVSILFEKKSFRDDEKLKKSLESGEYYLDKKWRKKYAEYLKKHDFENVRRNSMEADLKRRFLKKSGVVMIIFGGFMLITAVIIRTGLVETNVVFAVAGIMFTGWGTRKILDTPVKKFISDCGENLKYIENSYLNGKMLSYRRNGEHACNNGINIGNDYIIIYNKDKINVIEVSDIYFVCRYVLKTKYYGNSIYTGSGYTYSLSILLKIDENNPNIRRYNIDMNEFQVEMAYEAVAPYATTAELEQNIENDVYC